MSCFGEIIEPSSRALWEDIEDEESITELSWANKTLPKDIDLLLIMEGGLAVEFAKSCLIKSEPMDVIKPAKVSIYQTPCANNVVCTSLNEDDTAFGEITLLLQPWLEKSKNVICIQALSSSRYHNISSSSGSIIRSLKTSKTPEKLENQLEQPNILSGLTAGVLSIRDHLGLSGTVYAIYDDTPIYGMDSINTRPFVNLLNQLNIPITSGFGSKINVSSNLYM